MKTYDTILGEVAINDARIVRASGYGQYTIIVDIQFEEKIITLKEHSTDSQLFDDATDQDNDHSDVVMEKAKYIIERAIDDYISSL